MSDASAALPPKLQAIVDDFRYAEGSEKLELLLEYSRRMPPLPAWLQERHEQMEQVHECMTPVFVHAEQRDGRMQFYFDIPPESPTVRGYAALLAEGLNDATPEEVLRVPADFHSAMELEGVLSPRRLNGIYAILAHMKRLAARAMEQANGAA
ncbi:SufE family protein [Kallotenue papyrolyticum]|uniref:SufE family protein n=1 Tax=Kallotenue papyrolyticum TaxID=1325125 RepID=UPI0004786112|nr:SufE family protein [Kallotenue papyrolyticum]